ncbi:MAG: hypothetical protein ACREQY_05250 [Candidatus Binatia bacterium]
MELALPALLSHALVAFTIEVDYEFERRMPHVTSTEGRKGPHGTYIVWLTSFAMWANFLRYVPDEGIGVGELQQLARIPDGTLETCLAGMSRWGYVNVEGKPKAKRVVRLRMGGEDAGKKWAPLAAEVEERWQARFGGAEIDSLRASLQSALGSTGTVLPDYLPIARYQTALRAEVLEGAVAGDADGSLPALLAKVLLSFALEFETRSELALAMTANVLRVLPDEGVLVRDLPVRAGVSKEAVSFALGWLEKNGYAQVSADKAKLARPTAKGRDAQQSYGQNVGEIEDAWTERHGGALRKTLEAVMTKRAGNGLLLAEGLKPDPTSWRAHKRYARLTEAYVADPAAALPHYPMVLHRGGYPDGS